MRFSIKIFMLFLLILGAFGIWSILRVTQKHEENYLILTESSQSHSDKKSRLSHQQQHREDVYKEIWVQKDQRLQGRIQSDFSLLFLFPHGDKFDVIEDMENVRCMIQKEIFLGEEGELERTPSQEVEYFEANKATYNYTTNLFIAEEVRLWRYRLNGDKLPKKIENQTPLMDGFAQKVILSLQNGKIKMKAHHLTATMN